MIDTLKMQFYHFTAVCPIHNKRQPVIISCFIFNIIYSVQIYCLLLADSLEEKKLSKNNPVKTTNVATHCLDVITLPKKIMEPNTVKNFLVVVTIEQGRGPYSVTVKKIKNCPKALNTQKRRI